MKTKVNPWLPLALLAVAAIPFAGDGTTQCCNASTSLAAGVNDPTGGDQDFFEQSTGQANVMLLIDNSGSMAWLPQCPYGEWDAGTNYNKNALGCQTPQIAAPTATGGAMAVAGTCLPSTGSVPTQIRNSSGALIATGTNLAWMEAVVPQDSYADPGRGIQKDAGGNVIQDDRPTWGGPDHNPYGGWAGYTSQAVDGNCTGDNCLYDPHAYYLLPDLGLSQTDGSHNSIVAKRRAFDTPAAGQPGACQLMDANGVLIRDWNNQPISLGTACTDCMNTHGFYAFNVRYPSTRSGFSPFYTWTYKNSGSMLYVKGTFLNANPQKAVTSRKVLKDLLWIEDAAPSNLDKVRMGLAWFGGQDLGELPVADATRPGFPLGLVPTKSLTYPLADPPSLPYDNFKKARLPIMRFANVRSNQFSSESTPLAHTLLSVGQYFADAGTFGTAFTTPNQTIGGVSIKPFANPQFTGLKGTETCSICADCQRNSVVVVTDGSPNETEISWPAAVTSAGSTAYTANCGAGGVNCMDREYYGSTPYATTAYNPSVLPRVASYLHNLNIHPSGGTASNLTIYAVGFALQPGDPTNILQAAGRMGGGGFTNAANAESLSSAVFKAVQSASDVQASFSAPSVSAMQMSLGSASDAFISRFLPNDSNHWEGHVFAGKVFNEFANGCDASKPQSEQPEVDCNGTMVSANFNRSVGPDGNATCDESFLVDSQCKAVREAGSTGQFYQLDFATDPDGVLTGDPAEFAWDAGNVLNFTELNGAPNAHYRTAIEAGSTDAWGDGTATVGTSSFPTRNIWSVVPNGTGWARVAVTSSQVATLKPYLSIDATWCSNLLTDLGFSATSTPALPAAATDKTDWCAKAIIAWVRGFDLFDQDANGCGAPGFPRINPLLTGVTCANGQERNREDFDDHAKVKGMFWKLGDTFHSAPVLVNPPASANQCDLGYENQCVATIRSPSWLPNQTALASTTTYDTWWTAQSERRKVLLVGANDGMLHAFDAGVPAKSKPKDLFGNWQYSDGTGEELWAFIPPDLLPKLWRLVKKNGAMADHQYMVDGSTMVRDIWVDVNADRVKQPTEFRTVAILSERAGGTQYTALDVTDPAKPVVRWAFPRPCSDDAKYMGQSWNEFAPRPPPIGPVKIESSASRGFDERWIAMLSGGYDPAMGLGRAVFMVDAWTGETVWRFTDDDFKAQLGYAGAATSMFPVPGGVALADLGDVQKSSQDVDGFFDTASWADLGGSVFVARFQKAGQQPAAGRVTNWFAARAFEESRGDGHDRQYAATRSEFFQMPSLTWESGTRTMHAFLGSGNREHLMQKGGACDTNNLLGCCQAGCTVSSTTADNYGACTFNSTFACSAAGMTRAPTGGTCSTTDAACADGATTFTSTSSLQVTCPGAATPSTAAGTITVSGAGVATPFTIIGQPSLHPSGALAAPPLSRFYGLWAYGKDTKKQFEDQASARLFEANRFTDVALSGTTCSGPTGGTCTLVNTTPAVAVYDLATKSVVVTCSPASVTKCKAADTDAGWYYEYAANERTASGATVGAGCAIWNSLTPIASTATTSTASKDMCAAPSSTGASTSAYLSDHLSGVPSRVCGFLPSVTLGGPVDRSTKRPTSSPPTTPPDGPVLGKGARDVVPDQPGTGNNSKTLTERELLAEPVYWLEVSRAMHDCRHRGVNCE